jgi:hypothetical protein
MQEATQGHPQFFQHTQLVTNAHFSPLAGGYHLGVLVPTAPCRPDLRAGGQEKDGPVFSQWAAPSS